jgi:hypothetical protein
MPATGTVRIALRDSAGDPVDDIIQVRLTPDSGSAGGQNMRTQEFAYSQAASCRIDGVSCAPLGTTYTVQVFSRRHRTDGFIQRVTPDREEEILRRLLIDPARVRGIVSPSFTQLGPGLQAVLTNSSIDQIQDPSAPGRTLNGEALYNRFQDLQKACLLNVVAKASHETSDNVWQHVRSLRRLEQDRVFALLSDECAPFVSSSPRFRKVSGALHDPMPNFERRESFKTKDAHANLQVSFMQNAEGWAADIDIDEASGVGHAIEVIRNRFGGPTNPYQVRELLLLYQDPEGPPLDPGYTFRFA